MAAEAAREGQDGRAAANEARDVGEEEEEEEEGSRHAAVRRLVQKQQVRQS